MSVLRSPPYLRKGSKIAITSSARAISIEEISVAVNILESWGFEVIISDNIGLRDNQYAGTDKQRADALQKLLDREDIEAILCARGGYGTVRIMDHLDFTSFTTSPKWIIGYSDVTILHSHINNYLGIQTMHASMPINFEDNSKESLISIKDALEGKQLNDQFSSHQLNRNGECSGEIIGGNLSILYSILGTKSGFNPDHKILFIEDLDEYLYHVDRMMLALKRAGKLDKLKGLIVGGMTKMNDNNIAFGKTAKEIILEHCNQFDFPICFEAPFGHIDDNRAIKLGASYQLTIEKSGVDLISKKS